MVKNKPANNSTESSREQARDPATASATTSDKKPQKDKKIAKKISVKGKIEDNEQNSNESTNASTEAAQEEKGVEHFRDVVHEKVMPFLGHHALPDVLDFDKVWAKNEATFCKGNEPRMFSMACYIFSVSDINDVQQTFRVKYKLLCNVGITEEDFDSHLQCEDPETWKPSWLPYVRPFNSVEDVEFELQPGPYNERYTIQAAFGHAGGPKVWAAHFEIVGETVFQVAFDVHRCPYDVQKLAILFQVENNRQNFNRPRHWATWHWEPPWTASRWAVTSMPQGDYVLDRSWIYLERVHKSHHFGKTSQEMDQMKVVMLAQRNWRFFFWRVMFVLFIINCITIGAFLFDGFDESMSFASTMLVANIAFLYVTSGMVPHVSYLTMLDYYVYGSFVHMCSVVTQVCAMRVLQDQDVFDDEEAKDIRRIMLMANAGLLFIVNSLWTYLSHRAWHSENRQIKDTMASESSGKVRNASLSDISTSKSGSKLVKKGQGKPNSPTDAAKSKPKDEQQPLVDSKQQRTVPNGETAVNATTPLGCE